MDLPYSAKFLRLVYELPLRSSPKLLLIRLCLHSNDEGVNRAKVTTLAHGLRLDERQTHRLLRQLEHAGYSQVTQKAAQHMATVRQLNLSKIRRDARAAARADTDGTPESPRDDTEVMPARGDTSDSRGDTSAPRGDISGPRGDTGVPLKNGTQVRVAQEMDPEELTSSAPPRASSSEPSPDGPHLVTPEWWARLERYGQAPLEGVVCSTCHAGVDPEFPVWVRLLEGTTACNTCHRGMNVQVAAEETPASDPDTPFPP